MCAIIQIFGDNIWFKAVSCHDYEGVMSVLCTPLQVKCNRILFSKNVFFNSFLTDLGLLWEPCADRATGNQPRCICAHVPLSQGVPHLLSGALSTLGLRRPLNRPFMLSFQSFQSLKHTSAAYLRLRSLQEPELTNHKQHRGIIPLTPIDSLMPRK